MLAQRAGQGALTIGITNEAKESRWPIWPSMSPGARRQEKSVAATKTYTGQVLMLYLLAYALGGKMALDDLGRLPAWVHEALKLEARDRRALRSAIRFMEHAVVVGRGLNYANAFEFALKLMETCYVVAERFSSADFLHGPIAMVEQNFPVFLFAPAGVTWPGMKEMMEKLQALQAETTVITDSSNVRRAT